MILAPNEFVYVSDETKGNVDVFVGPTKQSLSTTDQPVIFDAKTKRFKRVPLDQAIQTVQTAPEGWYIVLKNPAKDPKRPTGTGKLSSADLEIGRKVNIPGPVSFPLWPGQMAKVLKGHHIRSNQYLLVRVYDEDAARKNWKSAVIRGADGSSVTPEQAPDLTMGNLIIIKGTEVSFYIPPTGIEVVPDDRDGLVREAVTLGRLEYSLLYDEDGNKRYERGPAVVFPKPTEVFATREVQRDGKTEKTRKHKAIELNENSGIYVKVIADYEENGNSYKVGQELFITGKDQMIYFPREEHAIVKYDSSEVSYGIAIPPGEARYVLDRNLGEISLTKGPTVFLPDPRSQVIVRRILDLKTCSMLYPGNQEALEHNAKLAGVDLTAYLSALSNESNASPPTVMMNMVASAAMGGPEVYTVSLGDSPRAHGITGKAARGFSGDQFDRKTQYTSPRTITLQTKWDGAVTVEVWTGYSMMLVRKSGEKRVVVGPQTVMLEYDESPQVLTLSRGKPKTTDDLLHTAYLLTKANKVSDVIQVETNDFCKLAVKLSYRVNFEGPSENWFAVENYVKFLCDHMRSKLRSATKKHGIEEFYARADDIIRDIVLGKSVEGQGRPGTSFTENGMRIYDVEVLAVDLEDKTVTNLLVQAQREVINHTLSLAKEKRILEFTRESETIKQSMAEAVSETSRKQHELEKLNRQSKLAVDLVTIEASLKTQAEQARVSMEAEKANGQVQSLKLASERSAVEQTIELEQKRLDQKIAWLRQEVQAIVDKSQAISPAFVAALSSFADSSMIEKVAEAMAPLSILGGGSVTEIISKMIGPDTKLGKHLLTAGKAENGTATHA
jgi:major vault protein